MLDNFKFETFVDAHSNIFEEYLSSVISIQAARNQFRILFHRGKDREPLQAVSESDGGIRYGEIKRFIQTGMYGADRNSGASGEALRYAAGSNLFPRLL